MAVPGDNERRRRRLLLLVMLVLAVVFAAQFSGLSLGRLPTRSAVEDEIRKLHASRKALARARSRERKDDTQLKSLNQMATPFWTVSGRTPHQKVRQEFDILVRRGQIVNCRVQNPRTSDLPGYTYLKQVEFTVSLTGTMKVVTRLLNEMERSSKIFVWKKCSLITSRSMPTEVRLTGTVGALVLVSEAQAMLAMEQEDRR